MNLQWFPLHIEAYTGDTMHLTTEEHGAYLLMMLAYYRTQRPLPAADRSLAALTKMPLDRWMEAKPALAPFFSERNGTWVHDRIEAEIAAAIRKHEDTVARAKAGAAARRDTLKQTAGKAQAQPKANRKQTTSKASADRQQSEKTADFSREQTTSTPQAEQMVSAGQESSLSSAMSTPQADHLPSPEQTERSAHLHLHINSLSGSEIGLGKEGDRADGEGDDPPDRSDEEGTADTVGSPIAPDWRPTLGQLQRCQADGATDEEIEREIATFVLSKRESGAFSHDWSASFGKWWERFKAYKAKQEAKKPKAPPRVEVNVNTSIDWDKQVARWKRNNSFWSRGLGPEPGMIGCQCPPEILVKHGIDPKTGLNLPDQSDTTAKAAT